MRLLDLTLRYFQESNIALFEDFVPYFVSSVGCHLVNLENQKREFYIEGGRVSNTRMHIFMCAPPGFMKTLLLTKMIDGPRSVLGGTKVATNFEGAMTEAAFTGTIKASDGEPTIVYGAAFEHREAILGIDEFAVLTNSMKLDHSINLDSAMLTSLDSGYLVKRLALGKIQYMTQLTLFTGSQPARFNLTSGLGRRFWFIYFIPTKVEEDTIKKARREGKNMWPSSTTMSTLKAEVDALVDRVKNVNAIEFDPSIYTAMDALNVPHYEEALFERLSVGYTAVTTDFSDVLEVKMTPGLQLLYNRGVQWRRNVKGGAELNQVKQVIRDLGGVARMTDVKNKLADFGLEPERVGALIDVLRKLGDVEVITEKPKGQGRPVQIVELRD